MTRIILESDNNKDVLLIRELADRLKIKYEIQDLTKMEKKNKKELEQYYKLINKGTDVSNYGDPSVWQKKVRKDRNVNFS
jgi:hypothetical protein